MRKNRWFAVLAAVVLGFTAFGCKTNDDSGSSGDSTPPGKVTDVKSTVGDGMVLLSWTNPTDSDFFGTRITFNPAAEGVTQPVVIEGESGKASIACIKGLANGTNYAFILTALDKSQNVAESVSVAGMPVKSETDDTEAPGDVTDLKIDAKTEGVSLTWKDPEDDDLFGIVVSWKTNGDKEEKSLFVEKGKQSAEIGNLNGGAAYTFTVKAMDKNGNMSEGKTVTVTPKGFVNIDNSGILKAYGSAEGIELETTVPDGVKQINFYRAEHGTENFYLAGIYRNNYDRKLSGTVRFTDYYVESGKTYDYYANCTSGTNDYVVEKSETDTVTATAGRGHLEITSPLTFNYNSVVYNSSYEGEVLLSYDDDRVTGKSVGFYFAQQGKETENWIVDSENLSAFTFNMTSETKQLTIADSSLIGKPLVPYRVKCNISFADGDHKYTWETLPVEFSAGRGFENGAFTVTNETLPFHLEDTNEGVKYCVNMQNTGLEGINRIKFCTRKDDGKSVNYLKYSNAKPLTFKTAEFTEKYLNAGKRYNFETTFQLYGTEKGDVSVFNLKIKHTASAGSGEFVLSDKLKIDYDPSKYYARIEAKENEIFADGRVTPEEVTVVLDGTECKFSNGSLNLRYGFQNASGKAYLNLDRFDGAYCGSLIRGISQVPGMYGIDLYPHRFRTQARRNYRLSDDGSGNSYGFDYYFIESETNFIEGLPESLVVNDIYSNKTFTVSNPCVSGFKEITFNEHTAGETSIGFKATKVDGYTSSGRLSLTGNTIAGYDFEVSGSTITIYEKSGEETKKYCVYGDWTVAKEPTCTESGTKERICKFCGEKEFDSIEPAHSYGEGIVTEEGKVKYTCTSCGYEVCAAFNECSEAKVGDIVLKDGKAITAAEYDKTMPAAAAVIVRANDGEEPALGVGLVHRNRLEWCSYSALGYSTNIAGLQGDKTSGYTDGRNGWEILKAACSDAGKGNDAELYPAWNFCNTYGEANGLTGDMAEGWYLPTAAELYGIYCNKTAIDESLEKAGGTTFSGRYYWSSSQTSSDCNYAWLSYFSDVNLNSYYGTKNYNYHVCCVRAF